MKNNQPTLTSCLIVVALAITIGGLFSGCASMKKFMGADQSNETSKPIQNPFGYQGGEEESKTVVLRSKKGNQSFEVELPETDDSHTDLTVPFAGHGASRPERGRSESMDYSYMNSKPGLTDRQIAGTFPQGSEENRAALHEIESELGLMPSESRMPNSDESYLAKIDHVKQLYQNKRYEAGLLEIDKLVRLYPTNPKLYEMSGTLLDKLGYRDLADRAWEESLELNPENVSLRRFLDRRKRNRTLSGKAGS